MNRNFEDTQYYLKRASEAAKSGIEEEIAGIETRVRELVGMDGDESVPESRLDELRAELTALIERAEGEALTALESARDRLDAYRAERRPPEQ
jgi:hypothetical protein